MNHATEARWQQIRQGKELGSQPRPNGGVAPTDPQGRTMVWGKMRRCRNGAILIMVRASDGTAAWTFMSAAMMQALGVARWSH